QERSSVVRKELGQHQEVRGILSRRLHVAFVYSLAGSIPCEFLFSRNRTGSRRVHTRGTIFSNVCGPADMRFWSWTSKSDGPIERIACVSLLGVYFPRFTRRSRAEAFQ